MDEINILMAKFKTTWIEFGDLFHVGDVADRESVRWMMESVRPSGMMMRKGLYTMKGISSHNDYNFYFDSKLCFSLLQSDV
jgi:hypothetical protein